MKLKLSGQVGDPQIVRENFNKIMEAFALLPTTIPSGPFIELSADFASITSSIEKRFVYVLADEMNNGDISLYIHNGTILKFLQTIA